jgi:arsenate reductase
MPKKRIPVPFEDPKAFDNTPQVEKYQERSIEIASSLCFLTNKIRCQLQIALQHPTGKN